MYGKSNSFFFKALLSWGVSPENEVGVNQNIRICNHMALSLCVLLIPYIIFQVSLNRPFLTMLCIFICLFYACIPLLNLKGYTGLSRLLMASSGHLALVFFAIIYGRESGVYQIFIISGFFSIIYFDKSEKIKQLTSFIFSIISIVIFELYFLLIKVVPITLSENEYQIMSSFTFYSTVFLVYSAMGYYYFQEKKQVEDLSSDLYSQKKELEDSRALYANLYEKTHDAVFRVELPSGKYLDANRAGEIITGRSVSELRNLTIFDVTPEGAFERHKQYTESHSVPGNMGEVIFVRPDGTRRIGSLSVVPMGKSVLFGLVRDITDQRRIEN